MYLNLLSTKRFGAAFPMSVWLEWKVRRQCPLVVFSALGQATSLADIIMDVSLCSCVCLRSCDQWERSWTCVPIGIQSCIKAWKFPQSCITLERTPGTPEKNPLWVKSGPDGVARWGLQRNQEFQMKVWTGLIIPYPSLPKVLSSGHRKVQY